MNLIYSDNKDLLKQKLLDLIKISKNENVYRNETLEDLNQLYDFLCQQTIFFEKQIIVLNLKNIAVKDMQIIKQIIDLNISVSEFEIYLLVNNKNIDQKIISLFKNSFLVKELTDYTKEKFIQNFLKENKISLDKKQIEIINKKLPKNELIIKNELSKILTLGTFNIETLICDYSDSNFFKIADYYLMNKNQDLFCLLNDFLIDLESSILLFNLLVSKLNSLLILKKAIQEFGFDISNICKKLSLNRFIVENDLLLLQYISINKIKYILSNLYELEKQTRINNLDFKLQLKLFILKGV